VPLVRDQASSSQSEDSPGAVIGRSVATGHQVQLNHQNLTLLIRRPSGPAPSAAFLWRSRVCRGGQGGSSTRKATAGRITASYCNSRSRLARWQNPTSATAQHSVASVKIEEMIHSPLLDAQGPWPLGFGFTCIYSMVDAYRISESTSNR